MSDVPMSGRSRVLVNHLAKTLREHTKIGGERTQITVTDTGAEFEVDLGNGRYAKVTVELTRVDEHPLTSESTWSAS